MECLTRMAYDVLSIGEGELILGLDTVDSLLGAHGLRAVSNNIVEAATGKPRYETYAILKTGRLKVGLTGMIPPDVRISRTVGEEQGVEIADGIARSREVLRALRKQKVDLAVLVTRTGLAEARVIADSLPGYDVVLAADDARGGGREPEKRGDVVVAAAGKGCGWLGELNLSIRKRRVVGFEGRTFEMKQDDGPVDPYLKELTYTKLEIGEDGERIPKQPREEKQPVGQDTAGKDPERG